MTDKEENEIETSEPTLQDVLDSISKLSKRIETVESLQNVDTAVTSTSVDDESDRIVKAVKEYSKIQNDQLMDRVKKSIDTMNQQREDELLRQVKEGLGIPENRPVQMSEVTEVVRKLLLEANEPGKRSETITKDKPTEEDTGLPKLPSADSMFDDIMKARGGQL